VEADFRRRFNSDLEIFFDKEDIKDVDHWQVCCHRALRDVRFFIASISHTYLRCLRAALLDVSKQSPAGIHGVGGMGKSALAQAFAYREVDGFPGGCWLLCCEGRDQLLTIFRTLTSPLCGKP
jgi:hypothetical protein